ncbi:hypothetical protein GCM10010172_60190 [Paractinoplanes ferrugineus]|uniref:Uncharacterized protein n=1 Tax=Paractinoplanes ferrugineus TaxID=113564 RepID=A0A919MIB9_9ACTN|nr:hypothetical protein Afe05nite_85380 [Actinoplanes ferrugineus]
MMTKDVHGMNTATQELADHKAAHQDLADDKYKLWTRTGILHRQGPPSGGPRGAGAGPCRVVDRDAVDSGRVDEPEVGRLVADGEVPPRRTPQPQRPPATLFADDNRGSSPGRPQ